MVLYLLLYYSIYTVIENYQFWFTDAFFLHWRLCKIQLCVILTVLNYKYTNKYRYLTFIFVYLFIFHNNNLSMQCLLFIFVQSWLITITCNYAYLNFAKTRFASGIFATLPPESLGISPASCADSNAPSVGANTLIKPT